MSGLSPSERGDSITSISTLESPIHNAPTGSYRTNMLGELLLEPAANSNEHLLESLDRSKASGTGHGNRLSIYKDSSRERESTFSPLSTSVPQHRRISAHMAGSSSDGSIHDSKPLSLSEFLYQRGFLQGESSDVTIEAFGKSYKLHRLILNRSSYFSSLFSGLWQETDSGVYKLDLNDDTNITQEGLELAFARLYGHEDQIQETDNVFGLFAVANYLDLPDLLETCMFQVIKSIDVKNVSKILEFCNAYDYGKASSRISDSCKSFLCAEGYEMPLRAWLDLPIDLVAEVVTSDGFYVPTEWHRCQFLIKLYRTRGLSSRRTDSNTSASSQLDEDNEDILDEVVRDYSDNEEDDIISQEDLAPIRKALNTGIHYSHMTFEQLQRLESLTDDIGESLLDRSALQDALWLQIGMRQKVSQAEEFTEILELAEPVRTVYSGNYYPIPADDQTMDSTRKLIANSTQMTKYPPFRFSVRFDDITNLKDDKRIYSQSHWYAGSYWNVYIQKVRHKRTHQLGVYLHRGKPDTESISRSVRDQDIEEEEEEEAETFDMGDEDLTTMTMENLSLEDQGSREPLFTFRAPDISQNSANAVDPSNSMNSLGLFLGGGTSSGGLLNETETTTKPEALPRYLDTRRRICAYFEIYTPSRRGRTSMTCFSSSPDMFNFSQSWGWKSTSLCTSADESKGLKFMIVVGLI